MWSVKEEDGWDKLFLKTSLKSFNRLNFSGPGWDNQLGMISSTVDLLDYLKMKSNLSDGAIAFEALRLLQDLKQEEDLNMQARALWNNYFEILWTKGTSDFFSPPKAMDYRLSNLRPEYLGPSDIILESRPAIDSFGKSSKEAVDLIFNVNLLKNDKAVWKVPYLIAYKELSSSTKHKNELDKALERYAEENLEYIHNASKADRFFTHGVIHSYFRIRKMITPLQKKYLNFIESDPDEGLVDNSDTGDYSKISADSGSKVNKRRIKISNHSDSKKMKPPKLVMPVNQRTRSRVEWTRREKIHACVGHNLFSKFKNLCHQMTARSEHLCFLEGESHGKIRTNEHIKDFKRRLEASGEIIRGGNSNDKIYLLGAVDECQLLEEHLENIIEHQDSKRLKDKQSGDCGQPIG